MHTATALFPNPTVAERVHDYSSAHSTPLPPNLDAHREYTIQNTELPEMMISPLQAQFMTWFARALGVKRILEIGTFTGYSALAWAEALKGIEGAEFVTLDINPETSKTAQEVFDQSPAAKGIQARFLVGPANDTLKQLSNDHPYDLIFIDADKPGYIDYLHTILERNLLAPGRGVLLSDNILQRGLVADSSEAHPMWKDNTHERKRNVAALDAYNKEIKKMVDEGRADAVVLPMFDGLSCFRLIK